MVILRGFFGESGTDGVEHDVVDDIAPFGVVLDLMLVAALLPKVAASAEGLVGVIGGASFEFFDGFVEVSFEGGGVGGVVIFVIKVMEYVDEQMEVVGHDAVGFEVVIFAVHVVELVFYSAADVGVLEVAFASWLVVKLVVVFSEEAFDGFVDVRLGFVGMVL